MATLYGIGVGPGAPDLLTLRAINMLHSASVILTAASPKNDYSLALTIARPHLKADTHIERLDFPMTRDKAQLHNAWDEAARVTAAHLEQGRNTAFLTLGDPLIYSTFAYLLRALRRILPQANVAIASGITSFQAAAAKTGFSLCEGNEPLTVIPGVLAEEELEKLLANPGTAAILKVYRNHSAIARALKATGRAENCTVVSAVEQAGERFSQGAPAEKPPYMTLILSPERDRKA